MAEELWDQTQRFSASNHENNFPHIMVLIEDRSLNYSLSIVYCEPISSSFSSVHLSISPHSIYLILIRSPLPQEYSTSNETEGSLWSVNCYQIYNCEMVSLIMIQNLLELIWAKALFSNECKQLWH